MFYRCKEEEKKKKKKEGELFLRMLEAILLIVKLLCM